MKIKKIYSIILLILVILTFTLTIFSFNNELRRSTYYNLIGVYKLYKFFTIRGNILSRDFESASHKILDYLESLTLAQLIDEQKNKTDEHSIYFAPKKINMNKDKLEAV